MLNCFVADCWGVELSVTLTVKFALPVMVPVRVPEIVPLVEILNPLGRVPLVFDQEYGVVPPVAVSGWE